MIQQLPKASWCQDQVFQRDENKYHLGGDNAICKTRVEPTPQ